MEAALHAEAIRHALSEVASSSQASRSQQSGWTSGDDDFDEMEEEGGSHLSSTALVGSWESLGVSWVLANITTESSVASGYVRGLRTHMSG